MLLVSIAFIAAGIGFGKYYPESILPSRVIFTFAGQFLIFYTVMSLFKNVSQAKPDKAVLITLVSLAAKLLLLLALLLIIYFVFNGLNRIFLAYFMLGYLVYTGIFVTYSLKTINQSSGSSLQEE